MPDACVLPSAFMSPDHTQYPYLREPSMAYTQKNRKRENERERGREGEREREREAALHSRAPHPSEHGRPNLPLPSPGAPAPPTRASTTPGHVHAPCCVPLLLPPPPPRAPLCPPPHPIPTCIPIPIEGDIDGAEAPEQWGFAGTAAATCVQGRQGQRAPRGTDVR